MTLTLFLFLGLGFLHPLDQFLYDWWPHQPNQFTIWTSHLGDNLAYLLAFLYAARLARRDRPRMWRFLLLLAVQHLCVNLFKAIFHSLRPLQTGQVGGFAYPSGHSAMATCVYGSIASSEHPAWWLLVPLVAWSRMALGHHWFSDVVGGCLLGWMCLNRCGLRVSKSPDPESSSEQAA